MLVDIYTSNKHFGKNLIVPAGIKDYKLPVGINPDFGSLKLVRAQLEIYAGVHNPVLNAADVISQIQDKGYAFHSYRRLREPT